MSEDYHHGGYTHEDSGCDHEDLGYGSGLHLKGGLLGCELLGAEEHLGCIGIIAECGNAVNALSGDTERTRVHGLANILSDGIVMGSIQIPNGQPIVMMADRQTTGGYAKLGTVASCALPLMAQKRPGDMTHFVQVSVEEAQVLRRKLIRKLNNLEQELNFAGRW